MSQSPPTEDGYYLVPTGTAKALVLESLSSPRPPTGADARYFVAVQHETKVVHGPRGAEAAGCTGPVSRHRRDADDAADPRWLVSTSVEKKEATVSEVTYGKMCFVAKAFSPQTPAIYVCALTLRSFETGRLPKTVEEAAAAEVARITGEWHP